MKDSFILYTEQKEVIDKLSDEQAGKLIKAIYKYVETEKMPELDKLLDIVIIPFKQNLDRNKEKYNKISEIRAKAGAKGGKQKKQKQTKEINCNDNVNDNVNENANVNVNDNDKVSDSCVDGLQKIIDFYNENIGLITPYGVEVLEDYSKDMPTDLIIYAMQISVEANKRTIKYIKAILNNWQKAGIRTLVQAKDENHKKKNESKEIEEWLNE
jgi:DnaD/phage-associated family protein